MRKCFWQRMVFLITLLLFFSCSDTPFSNEKEIRIDTVVAIDTVVVPPSGVVLTFDDRSVHDWYMADSTLSRYRWSATFCVSHIEQMDKVEIEKLTLLQQRGHEIAGHTLTHSNVKEYIETYGLEKYLQHEIYTMKDIMDKQGFHVSSFAYPYGVMSSTVNDSLLHSFRIIRGTVFGKKEPSNHLCYFDRKSIVYGLGIDGEFDLEYLVELLQYAKEKNKVLILYGHIPSKTLSSKWHTKLTLLEFLCQYIRENNMKFYTLSDLADYL